MKISNINIDEYNSRIQSLYKEVDYHAFQEHASLLVNQYHDDETRQQWPLFCKHLNEHLEKKPVKLLLMQLAFRCLEAPVTSTHLAQLITLCQQLKEVYGLKLYRDLMEADVPSSDRQISNYLAVLQLLIDMNDMNGLASEARNYLPGLQNLLTFLYAKQDEYIRIKYPQRNIDNVLEGFAKQDSINKFPLSSEVLQTFKPDYLAIESYLAKIKPLTQVELKEQFLESAKSFREINTADARQRMIAILVETIRRFYKIQPYDTQIIAFLALINEKTSKGCIAQIKAGEGKSTVFAMLVAYKAAQSYFVDLITSSSYLATRDFQKYLLFFEALGLTSSHISHERQQQHHFHAQILYGTNSDFEFALLRDGLNQNKLRYSWRFGQSELTKRTFDVVFIDEVDNMMLDATGAARMSIPGNESFAWVYKPIIDFVNNEIKNQRLYKSASSDLRKYLQKNIHSRLQPELTNISDAKLLRWLESAQIALYHKLRDRDYIVDKDIKIVDYANTGRTNEGCQWQHGIHQFIQVKECLAPTPESLTAASVSHPTYFSEYGEVYGLTGTMGIDAEREEVLDIYGVDSFSVPPHLPCQRITVSPKIFEDSSAQADAILAEIKNLKKAGRPMLILYESIMESNAFSNFLTSKGITHQLLNETQRESEDYIIARAGESGMVTIATNTAGRGTDILLSPESLDAGGLHQIFAFYPENSRVEEQGFCRGARQGQPGSCGMILQAKDGRILSLLATSPKTIISWINAVTDEDKILILDQLRTEKIKYDSMRRRHTAKLESLYYSSMNKFFGVLQSLRFSLNTPDITEKLKQICVTELTENASAYPLNIKSPHWQPVYQSSRILIANQQMGKTVDWSSLIDQFVTAFVDNLQEYWGMFYSRVSDDLEGCAITSAEKIIHDEFDKLNLASRCTPETVMNALSELLYKASLPMDVLQKQSETISAGFFSIKPKDLYTKTIQLIKDKKYKDALKFCEQAITSYTTIKGEYSIEVANCYSAQVTCYRESKQFDDSFSSCNEAIRVLTELAKKGEGDAELLLVLKKYDDCLMKSSMDILSLYPMTVDLYNAKNYKAASVRLLYMIDKCSETKPGQKGNCYSTLASCYRDLNDKTNAINACEKALVEFQNAKLNAPSKKRLIDPVLAKMEGIRLSSVVLGSGLTS